MEISESPMVSGQMQALEGAGQTAFVPIATIGLPRSSLYESIPYVNCMNAFSPRRALLLTLLLLLSACGSITDEGVELDLMSFNIRYGTAKDGDNVWELRKELVFDVLRTHSPQVVGLQEALGFQIEEIKTALPQYAHVGIGRDPNSTGEYSAILYRSDRFEVLESDTFWLSETPEVRSTHWGNKIVRICTWARFRDKISQRSFYVFNTHFDHRSQESRVRSAGLILHRMANRSHPEDPAILTGDFNAGEDNEAMRLLRTQSALVDTFRAAHPNTTGVGTFGAWTGKTNGEKIDYVFVEPDIETLTASILRDNDQGRYPSDHYPVNARIRF